MRRFSEAVSTNAIAGWNFMTTPAYAWAFRPRGADASEQTSIREASGQSPPRPSPLAPAPLCLDPVTRRVDAARQLHALLPDEACEQGIERAHDLGVAIDHERA